MLLPVLLIGNCSIILHTLRPIIQPLRPIIQLDFLTMRDANISGSTGNDAGRVPTADGAHRAVFSCGDKGPEILSFGKPPPEGTDCHWLPQSAPRCDRAIRLTEGLAIRFQTVRHVKYIAWTSVRKDSKQSLLYWGISQDRNDFWCPAWWIIPPEAGPGPGKGIKRLFSSINGGSFKHFGQRERLGFNNVVMLAQLDRAFDDGALPDSWIPPPSCLLEDGKIPQSQLPKLHQIDADLQRALAHLVPGVLVAVSAPPSGPDSNGLRYCLSGEASSAGLSVLILAES